MTVTTGGIGSQKHLPESQFGSRRRLESATMFAQLTLEARRTERALRELLRTVDAARIGVAWSGQTDQEGLDPGAEVPTGATSSTELTVS